MKRKIIKQGVDSYTISLPKEWIKSHNITKGSEVNIESLASKLIISSENIVENSAPVFVNFDEKFNRELMTRFILAIYKSGTNEINIKINNPEFRDIIQEILQTETMGFEIIESNNNFIRIKDIANYQEEIDLFMKRIFYLVKECMQIPIKREKIKDKNTIIKRLINFSIRVINKKSFLDHFYLEHLFSILTFLEKTRRTIWFIGKETDEKTFEKNRDIINDISELFDMNFRNHLSFSQEKSTQIMIRRREIFKEINKVKDIASVKLLARFSTIINEIAEFSENLISFEYYKKFVSKKESSLFDKKNE